MKKCVFVLCLFVALVLFVGLVFWGGKAWEVRAIGPVTSAGERVISEGEVSAEIVEESVVPEVGGNAEVEGPFIKRTIRAEWMDAPGKLSGRQRVRVVEADFKYPFLRLEEEVSTDPQTGVESVVLLRSSVADHLMVGIVPGSDEGAVREVLEVNGYRVRAVEPDSFILAEIVNFEEPLAQVRAMDALSALDEFIDFAEPDYLVFPCLAPNDPDYVAGKMWGLHNPGTAAGSKVDADIDAPEAWELITDASNILVAVTDTGIQYNHEDLRDNMWVHPDTGFFGFDAYDNDDDPMDVGGHGTHCAGTIGASGNNGKGMTGVAWKVQLMALRFLGPNGGSTSDSIRVVNYARLNGAHIISASWGGGGYSQGLFNAIQACQQAGIPFVAAAGNSSANNDATPQYPSSYNLPNIVAVASTTISDSLSTFSCYGRYSVDIGAPGSSIWSTYVGSNQAYKYLNGTSMAAPHVSGALALAMAYFPDENSEQLIDRLYASADRIAALNGRVSSGGRLNLNGMLRGATPPKGNDNFADAHLFEGSYGFWSGTSRGATREADEDDFSVPGSGIRSVWLGFRTTHGGLVTLDAYSNLSGYRMIVFEGSEKGSLKVIYDRANGEMNFQTMVKFNSKPDTEYRVAFDDRQPNGQLYSLRYSLSPANDFFSSSTVVDGEMFSVAGTNRGATQETFEQTRPHAGVGRGNSVWWRWTAPADLDFTINTMGSDFDTVLAVYTGSNASNLTEIASNDDRNALDWTSQVSFEAVEGTTYHIAVDGYRDDASGEILLNGFTQGDLFILRQPSNQIASVGGSATFQVVAAGNDLRYQWEFNGNPILGATQPSFTINNVFAYEYGSYRVLVYDSINQIYSDEVTLSERVTAPRILWQTQSQNVSEGELIDLAVEVSGSAPLTYEWFKNNVLIDGVDGKVHQLGNVSEADGGSYTVKISNPAGFVISAPIQISVFESPWDGWQYVDQASQAGRVFGIVKQNDEWVAASNANNGFRISRSVNGKTWTHKTINPSGSVFEAEATALAYGNGVWLVVGNGGGGGRGVAYKSSDLNVWQQIPMNLGSVPSISGLFFYGNVFYVRTHGGVFSSLNGDVWTQMTSPTAEIIRTVIPSPLGLLAFTNVRSVGWFLPIGTAATWQAIVVAEGVSSPSSGAYWHNDRYMVFIGNNHYQSFDGINWETGSPYPTVLRESSWSVKHGGLAYAGGWQGTHLSTDGGGTWERFNYIVPNGTTVAAADEKMAVFGTNNGGLFSTEDVFTADYAVPLFSGALSHLRFEGGQFIAMRDTTAIGADVAISADGLRWSRSHEKNIDNPGVGWTGPGAPIGVGNDFWKTGYPIVSGMGGTPVPLPFYHGPVPGASWLASPVLPMSGYFTAFVDGPAGVLGVLVPPTSSTVVGELVKSQDGGATWTTLSVPALPNKFAELSRAGDLYVYKVYFGSTYVSEDLVNWLDVGAVASVLLHEGEYWAWSGTSYKKSVDLVNWSGWTNTPTGFRTFSFNGAVVGVSTQGDLVYSYDGLDWVTKNLGFRISNLVSSGEVLVASGNLGQMARAGIPSSPAPVVSIIEPVEGTTFVEGSVITVRVEAYSPNESGIPVARLFYDGELVGEQSEAPYEFTLPVGDLGGHLLHVECQNAGGTIALAHKHIVVSGASLANQYAPAGEKRSLPGRVMYLNGRYFSVKNRDIVSSINGIDWERVELPSAFGGITGLIAGGDRLLGMSTGSKVVVTSDGINWMMNDLPGGSSATVNYSHGTFWALSASTLTPPGAPARILVSEDGVNWQSRNYKKGSPSTSSSKPAVGNPNGIMITQQSSSSLLRSFDGGNTWNAITGFSFPAGLSYDGHRFYIKQGNGAERVVGSSLDGIDWIWSEPNAAFMDLQLVNGVAFVKNSLGQLVAVSHGGLSWQSIVHPSKLKDPFWGSDGYFYASELEADPKGGTIPVIYRSANGFDWTRHAVSPTKEGFVFLSGPDGQFISTDSGGFWRLEPGGGGWTMLFTPRTGTTNFIDIAGDGQKILAIDGGSRIQGSEDGGATWRKVFDSQEAGMGSMQLRSLFHKNGVWLAWHSGNVLLHSADGSSFVNITDQVGAKGISRLADNGEEWMAIHADGSVSTSEDGLEWALIGGAGTYPDTRMYALLGDESGWYAFSSVASDWTNKIRMMSSVDGESWVQSTMPVLNNLVTTNAFAAANGKIIAGGNPYQFTADKETWINTAAHVSLFADAEAFYVLRNGWLERTTDGGTWEKLNQVGTEFTKGKSIGGAIYVFEGGKISRIVERDLAVNYVRTAEGDYAVGDVVLIEFELSNVGSVATVAGERKIDLFMSINEFYGDGDDSHIGTVSHWVPALQPGDSVTVQVPANIPNSTTPGIYRVGLYFDREGSAQERVSSNNFGMSVQQLVTIRGWVLTTSAIGNGQINQDSSSRIFSNGSSVSLAADAGKGSIFAGWAGDAFSPNNQITILMDGDKSLQANFANRATLQVFERGLGVVSGRADLGSYAMDEVAQLGAAAADGWTFSHWSGDFAGTEAAASILMDRSKAVTAHFVQTSAAWRAAHFSAEELLDPEISGDDADPDGDGVPNWQEYLHGSDPNDRASNGIVSIELDGEFLRCIYTRHTGAANGAAVICQAGRGMGDWASSELEERIISSVDGVEVIEARFLRGAHPRGFIRFKYVAEVP